MYQPAAPFAAVRPILQTNPTSVIWLPLSPGVELNCMSMSNSMESSHYGQTFSFQCFNDLLCPMSVSFHPIRMRMTKYRVRVRVRVRYSVVVLLFEVISSRRLLDFVARGLLSVCSVRRIRAARTHVAARGIRKRRNKDQELGCPEFM